MIRTLLLFMAAYTFGHDTLRDVPPQPVGAVLAEFHRDVNERALAAVAILTGPIAAPLHRTDARLSAL